MIQLGHRSFAWYLFHELAIRALVGHLGRPEAQTGTLKIWLLALDLSLVVAAMAYQWVEHPLERLLRHLGPGGGTGSRRPPGARGAIRRSPPRRVRPRRLGRSRTFTRRPGGRASPAGRPHGTSPAGGGGGRAPTGGIGTQRPRLSSYALGKSALRKV